MELYTVIDNLPSASENSEAAVSLAHEHGLCFFFSMDGKNYLVDTGASGSFIGNMEQMGLCGSEKVDAVFISHGHNDHTGGLRGFLEQNTSAPVYLHNTIMGNLFYSCRPKDGVREARNIGMEQALFAEYGSRFQEIGSPTRITEKITLIPTSAAAGYPTPMGNGFLYCNDFPDRFTHEVAILVEYTPGKFAVISPCSHNGILNILDVCSKWIEEENRCNMSGKGEIKYFIGGLHYVDYLIMGEGKKEAASITETANIIKEKYPFLKIFSGHCTCPAASDVLGRELGEQYSVFRTGSTIWME